MSLIHCDGFDNYTDLGIKYTTGGQSAPTILTSGGRDGRGCFFGNRASATLSLAGDPSVIVGFACKMSTGSGLQSGVLALGGFDSSNNPVSLITIHYENNVFSIMNPNSGGVYATGTTTILPDTWCYIEFLFTASTSIASGDVVLRVNGQVDATAPAGTNTTWSNVTQLKSLSFGSISGALNPFDCYVDDLLVLTPDEGFWGDVVVEGRLAEADGTYSQWSPVGAIDNYACVSDSNPDGDTTYVSSSSVNARDSYTFGSLHQVAKTISAVQLSIMVKQAGGTSIGVVPFFRQGGVDYDQSRIALTSAYTMNLLQFKTNPATGQPWTPDEIAGLEAGPKLTT